MENELKVNFERLKNNILSLSEIGKSEDRGIYRMAFTDADMQARKWLMDRIEKAGMEPSMDGAANVFGKLNCRDEITSVMVGSHLDTVPAGGHLDGALGVMVALECLTRIREDNLQTDYGLEMVAFSDEEGRFGGPFGSLALCGELIPDKIFTAADLDNVLLADEMKRHGLDPMEALHARRNPDSIHAFLELHIEQGPVLDRKGYQIGVVEDITGLFKWVIRFRGSAFRFLLYPACGSKDYRVFSMPRPATPRASCSCRSARPFWPPPRWIRITPFPWENVHGAFSFTPNSTPRCCAVTSGGLPTILRPREAGSAACWRVSGRRRSAKDCCRGFSDCADRRCAGGSETLKQDFTLCVTYCKS